MPDRPRGVPTLATLAAYGVVDAELGALLWLLVEGGVPLVVGGGDAGLRADVATAILGVHRSRPVAVLDVDGTPPSLDELAGLLRGGSGVALLVAGADLGAILSTLERPPIALPDDAVRRLGVVLVLGRPEAGPRVVAAHYLRPTERDGGGHLQRRPPAVLAIWDGERGGFEHYAWGVTPELGERVGRAQGDLEARQRDRAAFLMRVVAEGATGPASLAERMAGYLASEPARTPPPPRPPAQPSPFRGGLIDGDRHGH